MKRKILRRIGVEVLLMVMGVLLAQWPVWAQDKKEPFENRPERLVTMTVEYPGIEVFVEDTVSMNIAFHNKGKADENIDVKVTQAPENWNVTVKTYKYTITGLNVPSGEDKTLTFEAEPNKSVTPGKYEFRVEAQHRAAADCEATRQVVNYMAKATAKR